MRQRAAQGRPMAFFLNMVALLCAGAAWAAKAQTAPRLQCQVSYLSETFVIDAEPTASPYAVAAHDIAGRFQFKAVLVGEAGSLASVALYAYDLSVPNAPVLVHEVVYKPPFSFDRPLPGLTGWNHVYSARLGREMVYGCALHSAT